MVKTMTLTVVCKVNRLLNLELNSYCFVNILYLVRPYLEVVKEGRILHFVSGERRFIFCF